MFHKPDIIFSFVWVAGPMKVKMNLAHEATILLKGLEMTEQDYHCGN